MVALILLVVSSLSLGTLLLRAVGTDRSAASHPARVLLLLVGGMGMWCCILFAAGQAGLVSRLPLTGTLFAALIPGAVTIVQKRAHLHLKSMKIHLTPLEWCIGGGNVLFLLLLALCSFSPVTGGISNDEIHTHLSIPAYWLQHGGIAPQEYPVSYMAGNGELLFLLASAFSRGSGPRLVSWLAFVIAILLVYTIARRFLPRTPSLIAATILTVNPLLFRMSCVAFVDTLSMMFMLASLLGYLRWRSGASRMELFVSMALAGIGCGVKPTIVVYAGVLFLLVMYHALSTRTRKRTLSTLVVAGLLLTVFAAPWPVKLLLQTGSPTFPPPPAWQKLHLAELICPDTLPYTQEQVASFYNYVNSRYQGYQTSVQRLLTLPWDITMHPEPFQAGDGVGTLLLSLLPIALVIALRRRVVDALLLFLYTVMTVTGIYFAILPEARYFSVACSTAAPLLALPFALNRKYRWVKYGCIAVLAANCLLAGAVFLRIKLPLLVAAVDPVRSEMLRKEQIPYYEAFAFLEGRGGTKKVKVFFDCPVWYYLENGYSVVQGTPSDTTAVYLDIDYSQIYGRKKGYESGDFYVSHPSELGLKLLFDGGDARVYACNSTEKKWSDERR